MAVKGPDDADRITAWLLAHPFKHAMKLVILYVVPTPPFESFQSEQGLAAWRQAVVTSAQPFVDGIAIRLDRPHYTATGCIVTGDAADMIARDVGLSDLLVVSTHGRTGVHRFLFGSVSHSLVHRVAGLVLVMR